MGGGSGAAAEAIEPLSDVRIALRNNRRSACRHGLVALGGGEDAGPCRLSAQHRAQADGEPARVGVRRPPVRERVAARPNWGGWRESEVACALEAVRERRARARGGPARGA